MGCNYRRHADHLWWPFPLGVRCGLVARWDSHRLGRQRQDRAGVAGSLIPCSSSQRSAVDILSSPKRRRDSHPHKWSLLLQRLLVSRMPLQPYASAFTSTVLRFPEPQGTYFVYCSSVAWFLPPVKIERSVHWLNTLVLLPRGTIYPRTRKHYSVVNVRYSYDTILTLICQACMLGIWTNNEQSGCQHKMCKLLLLFVKSMVSLLIVKLSALLCIRCGVRSSGRGTPPKPQTRTRFSSHPLNGVGLPGSTDKCR